ncbi:hypothetical protein K435DRAFT_880758 [Dendrothele bispora CBS 962.96]|uniref:Uncharacterized protein n=1 Tax=Dendrothele bispora (strain CBS 962.96) TaxID=1314807 RepID=A0A4S8KK41_DENBC|nr:hypothetical protein K435DRAFT_880758 [Dendrothele bispora CBS 962.96]
MSSRTLRISPKPLLTPGFRIVTQDSRSLSPLTSFTGPTVSRSLLVDSRALTIPIDFVLFASKLSGQHLPAGHAFINASQRTGFEVSGQGTYIQTIVSTPWTAQVPFSSCGFFFSSLAYDTP